MKPKVKLLIDKVADQRGTPQSITVDNATEFATKARDLWPTSKGVHLDFIRPGKPVENGYIESFNGKLRDECLNVEIFTLSRYTPQTGLVAPRLQP